MSIKIQLHIGVFKKQVVISYYYDLYSNYCCKNSIALQSQKF